MPACWNKLLTALKGAVARVGIPSWFSELVMVFRGMVAMLNAPPTIPWTPLCTPAAPRTAVAALAPVAAVAAAASKSWNE